jgi:parallel beta-helix repeat protein
MRPPAFAVAITILLVLPATAFAAPQASRVSFWRLDESSGTQALDSTGAHNGTYAGGVSLNQGGVTPDGDAAVLLNGTDGRITTSYNPFASGSARTFEGWAKRNSSTTNDALLGGDATVQQPRLLILAGGNNVRFTANEAGTPINWTNASPGTGVWFHWVLVYDDSIGTATLYVNGQSKGTQTVANAYSGSPGNLELGSNSGTFNPFDGYLDEVAVYNRALSADEVGRLYPCDTVAYPPGTPGATITTPGQLDDALTDGQTGCFHAGTYEETNRDITTPAATFRPYPGDAVTWRGRMVIKGADVTIQGLTLDGSYGPVCSSDPNCLAADQAAAPGDRCFDVNKCTFSTPVVEAPRTTLTDDDISNRRPGDSERAGICVNESNSGADINGYLIARNRIHDCGQLSSSTGLPRNHDHGIYMGAGNVGNGGTISDNVIFDNADRGIQLYPNAAHVTIKNNTIDGNGEGVSIGNSSHDNTVDKNVITNSTVRWNLEAPSLTGTGNSVTNSCLRASNANSYYNQDNGIEASPPFRNVVSVGTVVQAPSSVYVNRGTKDFRLSAGTCRDNGWGAPDSVAAP